MIVNKRLRSFLLFAGLISICVILTFLSRSPQAEISIDEHSQRREQAEQQLIKVSEQYQRTAGELQKKVDELNTELQKSKKSNQVLKKKYLDTRQELISQIQNDTTGKNPEQRIQNCDSLRKTAVEYVAIADSSIANLEHQVATLGQVITIKDVELVACHAAFDEIKLQLSRSLQDQKSLEEVVKTQKKKERKRRFRQKVIKGGLLVLTGAAAAIYVQSQD